MLHLHHDPKGSRLRIVDVKSGKKTDVPTPQFSSGKTYRFQQAVPGRSPGTLLALLSDSDGTESRLAEIDIKTSRVLSQYVIPHQSSEEMEVTGDGRFIALENQRTRTVDLIPFDKLEPLP